jgi:hypothetical protein
MLERTDTPWYGSARLFRQPRVGDWSSVFEAVATALRQLIAARQADPGIRPDSGQELVSSAKDNPSIAT